MLVVFSYETVVRFSATTRLELVDRDGFCTIAASRKRWYSVNVVDLEYAHDIVIIFEKGQEAQLLFRNPTHIIHPSGMCFTHTNLRQAVQVRDRPMSQLKDSWSAYDPADRNSNPVKDNFYDALNVLLWKAKSSDIVVVPGDLGSQMEELSAPETPLDGRFGLDSKCSRVRCCCTTSGCSEEIDISVCEAEESDSSFLINESVLGCSCWGSDGEAHSKCAEGVSTVEILLKSESGAAQKAPVVRYRIRSETVMPYSLRPRVRPSCCSRADIFVYYVTRFIRNCEFRVGRNQHAEALYTSQLQWRPRNRVTVFNPWLSVSTIYEKIQQSRIDDHHPYTNFQGSSCFSSNQSYTQVDYHELPMERILTIYLSVTEFCGLFGFTQASFKHSVFVKIVALLEVRRRIHCGRNCIQISRVIWSTLPSEVHTCDQSIGYASNRLPNTTSRLVNRFYNREYQTFLDAVSRLALCGNVCITEEAVTIGEHGLLTGESLNALQHAGAISVYNTLQQNNWEFPVAEEGEVAVIKAHNPVPDEFLDSEKPIRSDWPAVHISECFVEGERAKLHGSVRPLRTFLPPTVVFRNAADVDEDIPEPELNIPYEAGADGSVELVPSAKGITVKRKMKDGKEVEFIPIEDYYFGRQEGNKDYYEEKGDFRFKCAVCQRIFYSNVKLMSHILGHVDESSQAGLNVADSTQCQLCEIELATAFDLRAHMEQEHSGVYVENHSLQTTNTTAEQFVPQTASQLLMQQRDAVPVSEASDSTNARTGEHVATVGMLACRICGKEANSELALAHHLQSTHREREMPYVCRLCLFRSSLFEDILEHFKKEHDNSNHLLCTYCLRIFTPSDARAAPYPGMVAASGALGIPGLAGGIGQTQVYLQHLRMHQIRHQLRRCPTCKLNFTNKSDYQVHRRLDHRATRGTSVDKTRDTEVGVVTIEEATDQAVQRLKETQPHITLMNAPEAGQLKSISMLRIDDKVGELACLECNQPLGTVDHKQYLPCSMCRFGTCCSMGYNRHMSRVHVYISGTHQVEPDTGMPLVRPVYFQWMADEVNAIEEFERQLLEQDTQQQSEPQTAGGNPSVCGPPIAEVTHEEKTLVWPAEEQSPTIPSDLRQLHVVMKYMASQLDARRFACTHCALSNLNGNSLARHLVEECGSNTVTLNPNPALVKARMEAEEQYRLQQEMQQHEQNEVSSFPCYSTLFKVSFYTTLSGADALCMSGHVAMTDSQAQGDVIMVAVEPDQLASFGVMETAGADQTMVTNELVSQLGPTGTTIDVTNANGEVVQQFIIPDDLQLEEGQTLVVIHGEDGQPQLAIVNQADLIDPSGSRMMLQSEEDEANGMLLYTNLSVFLVRYPVVHGGRCGLAGSYPRARRAYSPASHFLHTPPRDWAQTVRLPVKIHQPHPKPTRPSVSEFADDQVYFNFGILTGVKQRCVFDPTLSHFCPTTIVDAVFVNDDAGIQFKYRLDGHLFSIRCFALKHWPCSGTTCDPFTCAVRCRYLAFTGLNEYRTWRSSEGRIWRRLDSRHNRWTVLWSSEKKKKRTITMQYNQHSLFTVHSVQDVLVTRPISAHVHFHTVCLLLSFVLSYKTFLTCYIQPIRVADDEKTGSPDHVLMPFSACSTCQTS
ncbi:pogo transposable element with ZNF domain [Clonorchis sinensis]|uniref:Pogo transposable element with ZNF domain n=1 Tax=Clonorchis sinensis TaxID=79923 RepID=G7YSG2_CLOSI|nr:pogo transposable element with ZNF domain [Clonorchis sinensis]